MKRSTLVLGVGAVGIAAAVAFTSGDGSTGGGSGGGGGGAGGRCNYPGSRPAPLNKTREELIERTMQRVEQANRSHSAPYCAGVAGLRCSRVVATALVQALDYGLPLDMVAALAWRESRFNLHVEDAARLIAQNKAIGPLQVRPIAFQDVGMNVNTLLDLPTIQAVSFATAAGLNYLKKLREHYLPPGSSWCDTLHAYNRGPGAFLRGERNDKYVADIIAQALEYSELRTL